MTKILFVDDEPRWVEPYRRELQDAGFEVDQENTIVGAIKYLDDHGAQLSLLILDIMMPHGTIFTAEETRNGRRTGVLMFKRVRETFPTLPVIFLTNVSDETVEVYVRQQSCCLLIRKPECFPFELVDKVQQLLKMS
jgi:DNA-binding response OmpR family regulator